MMQNKILLIIPIALLLITKPIVTYLFVSESEKSEYAQYYQSVTEKGSLTEDEMDELLRREADFSKKEPLNDNAFAFAMLIKLFVALVNILAIIFFLIRKKYKLSLVVVAFNLYFWLVFI